MYYLDDTFDIREREYIEIFFNLEINFSKTHVYFRLLSQLNCVMVKNLGA